MKDDRHALIADNAARRDLLRAAIMLPAASALPFSQALMAAPDSPRGALAREIEKGRDADIARLREWIALPSIAAENRNMREGAQYMAGLARDAGFTGVEIIATDGHPGVFGVMDNGAPTTLGLYFMYDVKQFDPAEWSSPPLEGRIVDKPGWGSALVGRGAINQKGPEATLLAGLHAMRRAGIRPPVNLVLLAEGEEEIGSPHFRQLATHARVLPALKKCAGIFIPACWQGPDGEVSINLGAKGVVELELVASGKAWGRGPTGDIHSSNKASVDSPVWRLVQALQTLVTPDGNTAAIDGWFENVRPLTAREKELIAISAASSDEAKVKQMMGVTHWIDDLPFEQAIERQASQPTVNIEGLVAGYTGPGGKTILPGKAVAKLDLRLVPNQTRAEAERKLRAHLDAHGFPDVEMNVSGGYDPTEVSENARLIKAQGKAYAAMGVQASLYPRLAGSWPGSTFTAPPVSIPATQFGIGHGSGAHAPDEYFVIDSTNPKVAGMSGAALGFVELMYQLAAT